MTQPEAGSSLSRMMQNLRRAGVDPTKTETRKITALNEQATRATAMGSFWRDARKTQPDLDTLDIAIKLGVRSPVVNAGELGGEVNKQAELWSGSFPRAYAEALERPELYLEFCERFGITPYEGPDNHIPKDETGNGQTQTSYPYDLDYVKRKSRSV